jgi:hypothetical protein
VGADGLDVVDAGLAGAGDADAANGAAPMVAGEGLLADSAPRGGGVEIPAAALGWLGHPRSPGANRNNVIRSTEMKASQLLAQPYGVICGTGRIDNSHKNSVMISKISIIMLVASRPRLDHGGFKI